MATNQATESNTNLCKPVQLEKEREIFKGKTQLEKEGAIFSSFGKTLEKKPESWGENPDSSFWDIKEKRYINFQEFQERKRKVEVLLMKKNQGSGKGGGGAGKGPKAPGPIDKNTKGAEKPGSQAQKRRRKAS